MKGTLKTVALATTLLTLAFGGDAFAKQTKDPNKYDCLEVVGHKRVSRGLGKVPKTETIWECPYKDKMAAGQCETSWLFGMRCKK